MKNLLYGIILLLGLSGCSTFNPFIEQKKPVVKEDEFSDSIEILGVSKREKTNPNKPFISFTFNHFLRSFVSKEDSTLSAHSIYTQFYTVATGWLHLYKASIKGGSELDVQEIESGVSCSGYSICTHKETISITMPEELLLDHIDSGISVKVYGKSGHSFVINLSPEQISEQFKAIENL